jgi:hypothetical protein
VNALYELAHQVLQARDLSDPAAGLKVNWTMALDPAASAGGGWLYRIWASQRTEWSPEARFQRDADRPAQAHETS